MCALAGAALACSAAPASASLSTLLASGSCSDRDALDANTGNGNTLPFKLCDDGVPSAAGGTTPNATRAERRRGAQRLHRHRRAARDERG